MGRGWREGGGERVGRGRGGEREGGGGEREGGGREREGGGREGGRDDCYTYSNRYVQ